MPPLLERYRVFIYTGNFDLVCGALGVENMYLNLSWKGQAAWHAAARTIWQTPLGDAFQYSGYVQQVSGFDVAHIVVAGAGHMVPMNQPAAALDLVQRLVSDAGWPCPQCAPVPPRVSPSPSPPSSPAQALSVLETALIATTSVLAASLVAMLVLYRRNSRLKQAASGTHALLMSEGI